MKKWFNELYTKIQNMKYRHKLSMVMILVGIVPIFMIGIFMLINFRELLKGNENEAMEVALNQSCSSIEKQADIMENLVNYIVFDQDLQEILEDSQTPDYATYEKYVNVVDWVLDTPQFYHDGIEQITIYAESIEIPHDTTLAPLSQIEDQPWFAALEKEEDAIWVWPDDSHEKLLVIRKFPGFYEKRAYLGIYCSTDIFIEPLKYYEKEGAGMALVDKNNDILHVQVDESIKELKKNAEEIWTGYWHAEKDISGMPLRVSVFMREERIYSGFWQIFGRAMIVVCWCLIIIVIISRVMSHFLVKRIEKLTVSVDKIKMGSMKLDIRDESNDEVGILIRSFRKMMLQIHNLIQEVYESKIKQQNLEMQALQAQINPHFLYNSLSLINWKAIGAGQNDISKIVLALSDFYRTTLNKGETFISVEGEIKNIQSYLKIQLVMHDYDFDVDYQINLEDREYKMPKLILQPLVENALEHGLDLKEEGDKKLVVSCQEDAEDIIFTVQDNGVGMDTTTVDSLIKTHKTGYGLRNVYDRLVLLYGKNYGLHIESYPGAGTKIKIRIPKNPGNAHTYEDELGENS